LKKVRLLLVTLYYGPDVASNAVMLTALAQELSRRGHDVSVVSSFPHYYETTFPEEYRGKLWTRGTEDGVLVHRTWVFPAPPAHKLRRVVNYVSFDMLMFLSGLTMPGRYDVVMAVSPPLTLGLSGYVLRLLKGRSFVYNIQDVWPDNLISSGLIKPGVVANLLRVLERLVYNRATRLTALCDEIKADLAHKKAPADKIAVIPNYADCETIQPLPRQNPFRARLGLRDEFVVMYAGTLAYRYGLEILLEAAGEFLDRHDIRFVIVGHGPVKEELQARANTMGLKHLTFVPFQPASELPNLLATADVSVVPCKRNTATVSVPSKIYSIMASARPMVAMAEPGTGTRGIIERAGCGICIDPEDTGQLVNALRTLYEDRELCARLGTQGREYVVRENSFSTVADRYERLLLEVAEERHQSKNRCAI